MLSEQLFFITSYTISWIAPELMLFADPGLTILDCNLAPCFARISWDSSLNSPQVVACHATVSSWDSSLNSPQVVACHATVISWDSSLNSPQVVACHATVISWDSSLNSPQVVACHATVISKSDGHILFTTVLRSRRIAATKRPMQVFTNLPFENGCICLASYSVI